MTNTDLSPDQRAVALERQLADMRSERQYWNSKAVDLAALVERLERQLAEARATLTSGEATLTRALGVIVEFGDLNGFRNTTDADLGQLVKAVAVECSRTLYSMRFALHDTGDPPR
jgi:hypothetical protein